MSDFDDISIEFTDKHAKRNFTARYFPNRQIGTICETYANSETGMIDTKIIKPGMTREEILQFCSKKDGTLNLEFLIRSILYEAYIKEGLTGTIDGGNVRHFWYTHLKTIIMRYFGMKENHSVTSAINRAWKWAIDSGAVTYEEMDIYSNKESGRLSVVKDSPFTNIIIAVEKQNFYDKFQWIPRLFNCTLITAGGQPSRAVTRRFIYELKEDGVDLNQTFHMCIASDLDPSGYYIQETFKYHFDKAIEYYGGTGKVEIHRLFVRKDQVTPELLEAQGIAWQPDNSTETRETIWKNFCEKTDGGLYITLPDGWTGDIETIDGKPMVRALLEMDAFSTSIIENALVRELLKIIHETNDETKIMIPEVMRVFNEIKNDISQELFERWNRELIEPLKQEFLKDTKKWQEFIDEQLDNDKDEIHKEYTHLIFEKEKEKENRVPELYKGKNDLTNKLQELISERNAKIKAIEEEYEKPISDVRGNRDEVQNKIDEKCIDLNNEISDLRDEKDEEYQRIDDEYDFRMGKYNRFNEDNIAVFNPIEQALKFDIEQKLEQIDYRFRKIENRDEIRDEIGSLCVNTRLFLDENISCFDQPVPTFKGDKYLEKASHSKDLNIGNVRDSFPHKFLEGMQQIWRSDTIDFDFELSKTVEMKDITDEIKQAMATTEEELPDFINQREDDDDKS